MSGSGLAAMIHRFRTAPPMSREQRAATKSQPDAFRWSDRSAVKSNTGDAHLRDAAAQVVEQEAAAVIAQSYADASRPLPPILSAAPPGVPIDPRHSVGLRSLAESAAMLASGDGFPRPAPRHPGPPGDRHPRRYRGSHSGPPMPFAADDDSGYDEPEYGYGYGYGYNSADDSLDAPAVEDGFEPVSADLDGVPLGETVGQIAEELDLSIMRLARRLSSLRRSAPALLAGGDDPAYDYVQSRHSVELGPPIEFAFGGGGSVDGDEPEEDSFVAHPEQAGPPPPPSSPPRPPLPRPRRVSPVSAAGVSEDSPSLPSPSTSTSGPTLPVAPASAPTPAPVAAAGPVPAPASAAAAAAATPPASGPPPTSTPPPSAVASATSTTPAPPAATAPGVTPSAPPLTAADFPTATTSGYPFAPQPPLYGMAYHPWDMAHPTYPPTAPSLDPWHPNPPANFHGAALGWQPHPHPQSHPEFSMSPPPFQPRGAPNVLPDWSELQSAHDRLTADLSQRRMPPPPPPSPPLPPTSSPYFATHGSAVPPHVHASFPSRPYCDDSQRYPQRAPPHYPAGLPPTASSLGPYTPFDARRYPSEGSDFQHVAPRSLYAASSSSAYHHHHHHLPFPPFADAYDQHTTTAAQLARRLDALRQARDHDRGAFPGPAPTQPSTPFKSFLRPSVMPRAADNTAPPPRYPLPPASFEPTPRFSPRLAEPPQAAKPPTAAAATAAPAGPAATSGDPMHDATSARVNAVPIDKLRTDAAFQSLDRFRAERERLTRQL